MKIEPLKKEKEETAHTQAGRERERELNSKTLFYKDCSLGSVKNLTASPC